METMEMESTRKIGLVCFLAAFIGAGVTLAAALQFGLGWWLGPIGAAVFGSTAYLGYEWRGVGGAAVCAWRAAVRWRPGKDSWLWYGISLSGGILVLVSLLVVLVWGTTPPDPWFIDLEVLRDSENTPARILFIFLPSSFFVPAAASLFGTIGYHNRSRSIQRNSAGGGDFPFTSWRQQALFINPLTAPIIAVLLYLAVPLGLTAGIGWLVYKLARLMVEDAPRAPGEVKAAVKMTVYALVTFTVTFFRYLHSEERRICLTATALGVIVGFAVGYSEELVLLGAIAGGLTGSALGLAEYRLARWLRLVPAPVNLGNGSSAV